MNQVKGYKVFNPDWTCNPSRSPFQYEVGKTFEEDVTLSVCGRGFHFCKKAKDCFNYYQFDPNNKVAEVLALGDVLESGDKCCTNKILIVREITWLEVLTLVNIGKACTGLCNSGNCNSGNRNSGDWNSGNCNSGNCNSGNCNSGSNNSGDWNSGNRNSGNCNSGNRNSGNCNSGNCNSGSNNSGDWNSGNRNSGDWNSGNRNSGNCNSGNCNSGSNNSGDWNSGNRNSGNCNSGNCNSGSNNSGDWNSGSNNSGDWNKASQTTGCFNTESQKLKFFDKETDMTIEQWRKSEAKYLLDQIDFNPVEWIASYDMTGTEKAEHPDCETTGGCLKVRDNTDCCIEWWNGLSEKDKTIIKGIPNFDADKFLKITGIHV